MRYASYFHPCPGGEVVGFALNRMPRERGVFSSHVPRGILSAALSLNSFTGSAQANVKLRKRIRDGLSDSLIYKDELNGRKGSLRW